MIWGLPTSVEVCGRVYDIRSDFRVILDILAAASDPEFDGQEKTLIALSAFYPDLETMPQEYYEAALIACLWFVNGGTDEAQRQSPRLVDWEQDYPLIIAPINRVLGYEARAVKYMHWWTFLGAYQEIGDCAFAQVIRIRNMLARGRSLDKFDGGWYRRNRQLVDFKNRYTEEDEMIMWMWG